MKYLATAAPQEIYTKLNPPRTPLNLHADTSQYTPLQQRLSQLVNKAKNVSQYMDVDGNPTFVSTVMYPAIQSFIGKPNDVDSLLSSIEKQKRAIYGTG
jgi:multiple sugar transport system substrate-binding protein